MVVGKLWRGGVWKECLRAGWGCDRVEVGGGVRGLGAPGWICWSMAVVCGTKGREYWYTKRE